MQITKCPGTAKSKLCRCAIINNKMIIHVIANIKALEQKHNTDCHEKTRRCNRVIYMDLDMHTYTNLSRSVRRRICTLCLKKNRTPITFWNNSNKLCLIIIMITSENRQKVLSIVVCYGLTIFHKSLGYFRPAAAYSADILQIAHGLRCSIKARMHRPDICETGCKGGRGILSRCRTSTADASCDWTAGRWRVRFPAG